MYSELRRLAYNIACKTLAGFNLTQDEIDGDMHLLQDFANGLFSLPVNLPGCSFWKVNAILNATTVISRYEVMCCYQTLCDAHI